MTDTIIENYENEIRAELENGNFDFLDDLQENTFGEACYNMNTEQDLASSLRDFNHEAPEQSIGLADRKEWGISATEWYNQIELALNHLIYDRVEIEY